MFISWAIELTVDRYSHFTFAHAFKWPSKLHLKVCVICNSFHLTPLHFSLADILKKIAQHKLGSFKLGIINRLYIIARIISILWFRAMVSFSIIFLSFSYDRPQFLFYKAANFRWCRGKIHWCIRLLFLFFFVVKEIVISQHMLRWLIVVVELCWRAFFIQPSLWMPLCSVQYGDTSSMKSINHVVRLILLEAFLSLKLDTELRYQGQAIVSSSDLPCRVDNINTQN